MRACYSSMLSYFDCMFNYLLFKFRRSQGHLCKKDLDATGDNISRQNVKKSEKDTTQRAGFAENYSEKR